MTRETARLVTWMGGLTKQPDEAALIWEKQAEHVIWEREVYETVNLLRAVKDYTRNLGADFIVLLIPDRSDFDAVSKEYTMARTLLRALKIDFVDPFKILTVHDYDRIFPDSHWDNRGHAKAAKMMLDRLNPLIHAWRQRPAVSQARADHIRP